jgi:hypothetical protein
VIENFHTLTGVISEFTGGAWYYNKGIAWIGLVVSLLKEVDKTIEFDFSEDDIYEHLMEVSDDRKDLLINNIISIYKRSILLKNHFLEKFDQISK